MLVCSVERTYVGLVGAKQSRSRKEPVVLCVVGIELVVKEMKGLIHSAPLPVSPCTRTPPSSLHPWAGSTPSFHLQNPRCKEGAKFFPPLKRLSPSPPPPSHKMVSSLQIPLSALRIQNQLPPHHIHTLHSQTEHNINTPQPGPPVLRLCLLLANFQVPQ
jgi:hypothetical protein